MDKDKFFLLKRGKLDERLDPLFYKPSIVAFVQRLIDNGAIPLHKVVKKVVDGPFGTQLKVEDYVEEGVPVIRVSNVRTGEISEDHLIKILPQKHKQIIRSRVLPNDVLLTKAGAILGYSAVFPEHLQEGNITSHLVTITCGDELLPHYLKFLFHSEIGQKQIYRWGNKSTRPELNTQEVKRILIPLLDKHRQQNVIELYESSRKLKRTKEQKANQILDSLDDFVCSKLGFTSRYISNPIIEERIYKVGKIQTFNGRLDPYYHQTHFGKYFKGFGEQNNLVSLKHISNAIFTGKTPPKDKYTEEETNIVVKAGALKGNEVRWSKVAYAAGCLLSPVLKNNDILLLSAAHQISYIGKNPAIVIIPEGLKNKPLHFVGEILCIRPDVEKINPFYLLAILKTKFYYQLINRETRGQTSHLYPNDVSRVKIPIPKDMSIQLQIAKELQSRLSEAESLFETAAKDFQAAKKEIQKLILG